MALNKNVLIALDASEASMRAVSYVAGMLHMHKDLRVYLLHVLPPIPPELLEYGGSEDPQKEQALSEELRQTQTQWVDQVKKDAEPIFERAKAILQEGGVSPDMVEAEFSTSIHRPDIVRDVLETASSWHCSTIVVGRRSHSWLKEHLGRHVSEDLARRGQGFAIWTIE